MADEGEDLLGAGGGDARRCSMPGGRKEARKEFAAAVGLELTQADRSVLANRMAR